MNTETFWAVIGSYNSKTIIIQIILLCLMAASIMLSYSGKIKWIAKLALGIINIYIGIVFFGLFGTEPIQKYFALPLYLACGALFIYESIHNKDDMPAKPNRWQIAMIFMYILYPVVSLILGNEFPKMVTYIMPCPVISISIAIYSCYSKKNKLLLCLLAIWGITGIKSVIFSAYEDIILLICGIYAIVLLVKELKRIK